MAEIAAHTRSSSTFVPGAGKPEEQLLLLESLCAQLLVRENLCAKISTGELVHGRTCARCFAGAGTCCLDASQEQEAHEGTEGEEVDEEREDLGRIQQVRSDHEIKRGVATALTEHALMVMRLAPISRAKMVAE